MTPLSPTLDHVGLLAATCDDAALLFKALTGYDPKDLASRRDNAVWHEENNVALESLKGIKIGFPEAYLFGDTEPEVRSAIDEAMRELLQAGAEIVPVELGVSIGDIKKVTWSILHAEAYKVHQGLLGWAKGYGPRLKANLEIGRTYSSEAYAQDMQWRAISRTTMMNAFDKADVLITPTCPVTAGPIEDSGSAKKAANGEYTPLANLWGLPAVSVPAGFSADGMPIGMQITGRPFEDSKVLAIGRLYEQISNWREVCPNESRWL